jgi:RHS repeat-associated protein
VLYRQNLVDAMMSELYQYDNLNQLTSFARGTLNSTKTGISGTPSRSQSWTPDALGNFTGITTDGSTQTRTANQQNEYTSISGSGTITYDANGNITADGSGNTYVYDAWNRLVAVKSGTTTLAAYGYDGLGRRISETHGSNTTDLYYSSYWQVLEEHVNGQLQARYVWSPAGIDTLVLRDDSSQNNGMLDRRLYVQQDANGNVTALIDTNGNVVERYDYDPYGAVTVLNPDFSVRGTSSYNWNYFFQGKRYDGAVGLYDSRERIYSPTLMRPLQTDPLGLYPGNNDYGYTRNNPINRVDPNGLESEANNDTSTPAQDFWNDNLKGKGGNFDIYKKGCIGLASNRLGLANNPLWVPFAMKNKHCFPTLQAAEKYQKSLANQIAAGEQANIFAVQFGHNYLLNGNNKALPPDKEIDPNNINWLGYGNVATLHQPDRGGADWEWMNNGYGDLVEQEEPPVVKHRPVDRKSPTNGLPGKYPHVIYCVVVIKQHELAPPTPIYKPRPVPPPNPAMLLPPGVENGMLRRR